MRKKAWLLDFCLLKKCGISAEKAKTYVLRNMCSPFFRSFSAAFSAPQTRASRLFPLFPLFPQAIWLTARNTLTKLRIKRNYRYIKASTAFVAYEFLRIYCPDCRWPGNKFV
jgi:hypothetical protein